MGSKMPELPEVETMVRGLREPLVGKRIRLLKVLDPFLLQGIDEVEFSRRVMGRKVQSVDRRGKWVVISFDSDTGLIVIQPRMTGGFWLVPPVRPNHARLLFHVVGRRHPIWFCDARRLGKIAWHADQATAESVFAKSQGPDALVIGREDLEARLARTSRGIKPALMGQKVLAGIGNIYADEVLFRSRIHPERPATSLTSEELERLYQAIPEVLREAIEAEGSSFDAGYRTVLGLEGGFLTKNAMYGRGGLPCPSCGSAVVKTRIAGLIGRPTHFCPICQPSAPF